MSHSQIKILLIEGNARQVLPMAKSLRELGHHVTTFNSTRFDFGYTSRYPHNKILCPIDHSDEEKSINIIIEILKSNHFDLIIPMNDQMAILLSKYKSKIEKYSSVAVNEWSKLEIASDKLRTMKVCMENNIPCPYTATSYEDFCKNKENFKFPVVVKPRTGCGAVGFHVAVSEDDLKKYIESAEKKYGNCLIQEYIPQTDLQYKAELFIDKYGQIKSAVVFAKERWYPVNGGSSTLNRTVDRKDIIQSCSKLLQTIKWRGYADIDLIQDPRDNIAKIIEINPRVTGSVKICFKAGVNFSQQIVEDYLEKEITSMLHYEKNVYLRYFQKDILWLLKSPNRFSSNPSWFNFKNNVDQIFDLKDPMPFLISCVDAIPKMINDSKKRKLNT